MKIRSTNIKPFAEATALVELTIQEIDALSTVLSYSDIDRVLTHEAQRDSARDMERDFINLYSRLMKEMMGAA